MKICTCKYFEIEWCDISTIKSTIYNLYELQYSGVYNTVVKMIDSSQAEYVNTYNEVLNNIKKLINSFFQLNSLI